MQYHAKISDIVLFSFVNKQKNQIKSIEKTGQRGKSKKERAAEIPISILFLTYNNIAEKISASLSGASVFNFSEIYFDRLFFLADGADSKKVSPSSLTCALSEIISLNNPSLSFVR